MTKATQLVTGTGLDTLDGVGTAGEGGQNSQILLSDWL